MTDADVRKALAATAAIYDRRLSADAVQLILEDLAGYPVPALLMALARCRKELRTFPTVADIVARIDDGRPGPEEAWAMVPKSEAESVVWTTEVRDAFAAARPLIDEDPIAARMTFLEVYRKLLAEARAAKKPPRWEPSLGLDAMARERVLRKALDQGRLTHEQAGQYLPDLSQASAPVLTGPTEDEADRRAEIADFLNSLRKALSLEDRIELKQPKEFVALTADQEREARERLREQAKRLSGRSS